MESQGLDPSLFEVPASPVYNPDDKSNPDWVQKEMADNKPSTLISIDPGFANLGYAKAEYTLDPHKKAINLHFTQLGTHRISDDPKGSIPEFTERVASFFNRAFPSDNELKSCCVLIEQQYNKPAPTASPGQRFFFNQLQVLYTALHSYASGKNCFVDTVHPNSVKALFKTKGLDYNSNKEAAMNFCRTKLQISTADSHQSDAILQACCWLQSNFPDYALNVSSC